MPILFEESFGSWIFSNDYPQGADETFDSSLDLLDAGKLAEAEVELKNLLLVCPEHIDALHHLAILFSQSGRDFEAYLCTREAVRIGLEAIPSRFSWLTSRMLWGHLENRPFMRAYHSLGLHVIRCRGSADATEIFARLVAVNVNDNLGARYSLMQCLLDIEDWQAVDSLARKYHNDTGPDIFYSHVVALIQLGQSEEAFTKLKLAVKCKPNVANELLKTRHSRPESDCPGHITIGGDDEAFDYWERNKSHWERNSEVLKLLKAVVSK